ncbi:glycosyltransferase family 2 protein [Treponema denticola]|uniref:Glycosyltransferase 2-like domain-containing protein n=1 Tax=Treponema denticola H-22 TaxID=999432 RepID=A0A0E2E990_TREDN|nr:glycosyltransferase family A protein [Treponema denticola]EMB36017.1 hypothetical protein HMPREF9726_00209 [Treponema denticola H-22]
MNKPKYSIIIPVNNVINYLPSTIESIISQNYSDYELVISDDSSTDGTSDYISSLKHPNIKVFHTQNRLTVAEHFDLALSYATGEWRIFVGGDDGLQPYFFKLADRLTEIAIKKNIRAIASRRAYFFWNGCQSDYGDVAVSYSATVKYQVKSSKKEMYRCLYSKNDYFNLPQMYTTSLFHSSLIDKVRRMQNGKFLTYGISDANMAAISVTMEKKYLYSELPLGWVGTSPKVLTRSKDFIESIKLHYLCGNYRLGFASMYFLGALLTIETSNKKLKNKLSNPKKMEKIISSVYKNLDINSFKTSDTYKYFLEVLKINEIDLSKIIKKTAFIKNAEGINKLFYQIMIFPWRCIRYMLRRMPLTEKYFKEFNLYLLWVNSADITMQKASEMVLELMKPNLNFKDL